MIGNDLVDLRDPEAMPQALHPGFDRRVFTPAERELLAASATRDRLRWILWSAKESAFKLAKRLAEVTVFSPVRFAVFLEPPGRARVAHAERVFDVALSSAAGIEYAHAIARPAGAPPSRTLSGVSRLPRGASDPGAAGREARALAISGASQALGVPAGEISIGRAGRLPTLLWRGLEIPAALSLSHHGRFAAFACALCADA